MTAIAAVRQAESWSALSMVFGIALLVVLTAIAVWGVRRFLRGG